MYQSAVVRHLAPGLWRRASNGLGSGLARTVERARARPTLVVWIVGVAAGIQMTPAYFWTPVSGYLVDDLGLSRAIAGSVSSVAFLGMAAGILAIASIAQRYDQRRLVIGLAVAGALAMAIQGVFAVLPVVAVATVVAAFVSVGMHVMLPLLLSQSSPDQRGRIAGAYATAWIAAVSAIMIVEPIVVDHTHWRVAALCQGGIGLLSAPLVLLSRRDPRPRDRRPIPRIWGATLAELKRSARMRRAAVMMGVSGACFGIFHSTYSPLLEAVEQEHMAWLPALAFTASVVAAPAFGLAYDRRSMGREGAVARHRRRLGRARLLLVIAAAITAAGFAIGGLQLLLPALTLGLITLQGFVVEVGTTGKTAIAPPAMLDDDLGDRQNVLLQAPKFLFMFVLGLLASAQLGWPHAGLTTNLLGAVVGFVGIAIARGIPLAAHAQRR